MKLDSSHDYVAFLVSNATSGAKFLGKWLRWRCNFNVIGLKLIRGASGIVLMRTKMPFVKLNGKSE